MLPALLGLPSKLNTVLDRLSATKSGYLDAAITSRAEGGTVYSSARAALLDYLDADISSRAITPVVQTGYLNDTSLSTSTGEDADYSDVPIDPVSGTDTCLCVFQGDAEVTARLTATDNLRLATMDGFATAIRGRWYVIDFGS